MKKYRGSENIISPPETGWAELWFADGYKAERGGATIVKKEGGEWVKFYLRPFEHTAKRYEIDLKEDLDENGYCYKWYPKVSVYSLNTYDPARRIFFSLLNWEGKPTEATKWFKGEIQGQEIIKLGERLRAKKAECETLKEENMIMKTNVMKYLSDNVFEIMKKMMPSVRSLMMGEQQQM